MMKKKSNRWSCTKAVYLLPVVAVALAAFATPEFTEKADAISESNLDDLIPVETTTKGEVALPFQGERGEDLLRLLAAAARYSHARRKILPRPLQDIRTGGANLLHAVSLPFLPRCFPCYTLGVYPFTPSFRDKNTIS